MKYALFAGAILGLCVAGQASADPPICKPFAVCSGAKWFCAEVTATTPIPAFWDSCTAGFKVTMYDKRSGIEREVWQQKYYHRGAFSSFVTRDGRYFIDVTPDYGDKLSVVVVYGKEGTHGIPGKAFYFPKKVSGWGRPLQGMD